MPLEDRAARLRRLIDTNANVDLHAHTRHTDGAWTPTELAADGVKEGLAMFAVTDHDVVTACAEFELAAYRRGLLPVAGCEVTVTLGGKNYHVLSYDLDPEADIWPKIRNSRPQRRRLYFEALFSAIRDRGHHVTIDMALDENGELVGPATSAALIKGGVVKTENEARELLNRLKLDYPIHILAITVDEYAEWLPTGGAICSIAHAMREEPGTSNRISDEHLDYMQSKLPIIALECHHPYHKPDEVETALAMAKRHNLAVTAGSDAHGYKFNRPPRPYPAELSRDFLEALYQRWRA